MARIGTLILFLRCVDLFAQPDEGSVVSVRLSVLLAPFTPLLTVECRTLGRMTVQLGSNFTDIHGMNLKYFVNTAMHGGACFVGMAFVRDRTLREDLHYAHLPYAGYTYAYRFGRNDLWDLDSRLGLGYNYDGDAKGIYPVIKTGVGLTW